MINSKRTLEELARAFFQERYQGRLIAPEITKRLSRSIYLEGNVCIIEISLQPKIVDVEAGLARDVNGSSSQLLIRMTVNNETREVGLEELSEVPW